MTDKLFTESGEPIDAQPLSENELENVSGGTRERPPEAEKLQVQISLQRENQVFTSVSNVLKGEHDTPKNSIGNVN